MPKGIYRRSMDHCLKIKLGKAAQPNKGHTPAVKQKISLSVKKVRTLKARS